METIVANIKVIKEQLDALNRENLRLLTKPAYSDDDMNEANQELVRVSALIQEQQNLLELARKLTREKLTTTTEIKS
jgi:hypothetical protein